jgi:hypothetical protein
LKYYLSQYLNTCRHTVTSVGGQLDLETVGELNAVQEVTQEDWAFLHSQVAVLVNVRVGPDLWEVLVKVLLLFLTVESKMGSDNFSTHSSHTGLVQVEMTRWSSINLRFKRVLIDE